LPRSGSAAASRKGWLKLSQERKGDTGAFGVNVPCDGRLRFDSISPQSFAFSANGRFFAALNARCNVTLVFDHTQANGLASVGLPPRLRRGSVLGRQPSAGDCG
jgi:hypothetical protein